MNGNGTNGRWKVVAALVTAAALVAGGAVKWGLRVESRVSALEAYRVAHQKEADERMAEIRRARELREGR